MDELSPRGFASFVAAGLGAFSWFALPWVVITVTNGLTFQSAGLSSGNLIYLLFTAPATSAPSPNPAVATWEARAEGGFELWTLGAILYALGLVFVAAQILVRLVWGGFLMLGGTLLSTVGILSFTDTIVIDSTHTMIVGPSVGLYLGVIAAVVSLAPLFQFQEEAEWESATRTGRRLADIFWLERAALEMAPDSVAAGTSIPERRTRSYCPRCGRGFYGDDAVCLLDGTPLRSTRPPESSTPDAAPATSEH